MKKILLLSLLACCCLIIASCEKEGSHSLDGSRWVYYDYVIKMKDGLAQYNEQTAVPYTIKGNTISFSDYLYVSYVNQPGAQRIYCCFEKVGILNDARTSLTLHRIYPGSPTRDDEDWTFNRILE